MSEEITKGIIQSTNDIRMMTAPAAQYLGMSQNWLDTDRMRSKPRVPYIRIGRRIYYRQSDLDRYLDRCVVGGEE